MLGGERPVGNAQGVAASTVCHLSGLYPPSGYRYRGRWVVCSQGRSSVRCVASGLSWKGEKAAIVGDGRAGRS